MNVMVQLEYMRFDAFSSFSPSVRLDRLGVVTRL
jgi:hypothetical protein